MNTHQPHTEKLHTAAQTYLGLGWSVIPTNGKVAALPWTAFQQRRASEAQIEAWFSSGQFSALAIITGIISQLVVLDFDDLTLFERFAQKFPSLMDTLTVETYRGLHLYYEVPSGTDLRSLKLPGLDVQYNGKYVIAPPSIVEGFEYTATRWRKPYKLTLADVLALLQFFAELQAEKPTPETSENSRAPYSITLPELIHFYQQQAVGQGRNQALFQVSILARDCGYSLDEALALFTEVHVAQKPNGLHRRESARQRKREALATIRSAYKRLPQPRKQDASSGQLPNVIREALLQRKATFAVRTLELLRLRDVPPGKSFTEQEAIERLTGAVGRESIRSTLNMLAADGQFLIERHASSYPPPGVSDTAFEKSGELLSKTALRGVKNPDKLKPGPKPRQFIMPDDHILAARLGVKYRAITDPLPEEALKSARRTRMALHAKFIERKPGQYPMKFLAQRLTVSERTIQNYHALMPEIQREVILSRQPISWHNLNEIPEELPHQGFFLTDSSGKRYPAKPGVARRLLGKEKAQLTLNRQMPNAYWYKEKVKPLAIVVVQEQQEMYYEAKREKQRQWVIQKRIERETAASTSPDNASEVKLPGQIQSSSDAKSAQKSPMPRPVPKKRRISGKRALSNRDEEGTAHYLYKIINQMSMDKEGQLSLVQARKIVVQYGEAHTLSVLWRIQKRREVKKPVGLLCTILRCEQKFPSMRQRRSRSP